MNYENTSDLVCFFECMQDNDLHTLDRMLFGGVYELIR